MVVKLLLWVLFVMLVLIIPVIVIRYQQKIKYKKTEIMMILSGKLSAKYLSAYFPKSPDDQKNNDSDDKTPSEKLNDIVDYYLKKEYSLKQFIIPLIILICFVGIGLICFIMPKYPLIKLSVKEIAFLRSVPDLIYFGFLGAFISGLIATVKRYNRLDITPSFVYSVNAAILLCSVLGYLWSFIFTSDIAIFISFGTGFFPLVFLQKYIRNFTMKKLDESAQTGQTSSDLYKLQGLNKPIIERLEEEGIHSCQGLAYCDPILLLFKTNFQLKIILDWIDQALLYNYLDEKIQLLRPLGIRGVVEFALLYESVKDDASLLDSVSTKLTITPGELNYYLELLHTDPHIVFISDLFSESAD